MFTLTEAETEIDKKWVVWDYVGVFALTETVTVIETDEMGWIPIDIGHCFCLGWCEHLHTIPYNSFFIDLDLGLCHTD